MMIKTFNKRFFFGKYIYKRLLKLLNTWFYERI